ncbi:MAG: uracil-DNA glycosylase [Candidatus Nitrosopolaris wilkensis]|nr:MAG: uracil-DNA glycosylase [Candidatus Nitrosopolaris wilkensis]
MNERIIDCKLCPRLIKYSREIGKTRIQKFTDEVYWAKPVPTFGDPKAKLLVIGLAPAARGGNRTGRIFTGDSSGDWLVKALFETGFANKPTSVSKDDGLILKDAYLTAAARCAPPENKPNPSELVNCSEYLKSEIKILEKTTKVVLTLGKIAFDAYCKVCNVKGLKFGHNKIYPIHNDKTLIVSYHPSRRNTNTGTLTWQMWINIFQKARSIINN